MSDRPPTYREKLQSRVLGALMRLPSPLQLRIAGKSPPVSDRGESLHPELHLMLAMRKRIGTKRFCDLPPAKSRAAVRRESVLFAGASVRVGEVTEIRIGELSARLYAPASRGPRPLLVYFHGGGFVLGDLDSYDAPCRLLCRDADVNILSVDYRLAPEAPFPAALDDARTAFDWALANAGALGADPARVAIGGDSAGANLATVTSQAKTREGGKRPVLQLLIYPPTDRTKPYASLSRFAEGGLITSGDMTWFHEHYLKGADPSDPRISPLLAPDLSGLPRALVVTANFDPLRDEVEAYAAALTAAGTPTTLLHVPGMLHGFVNCIGFSRASRAALARVAEALKMELSR